MKALLITLCGTASAVLLPAIAHADLGSCQFRIYSAATGKDVLVCQTANSVNDCGTWPKDHPTSGYAEGKAQNQISYTTQACDVDSAIGACLLPNNTKIFFYEGLAKSLAIGCGRMQGEWKDLVNDKEAQTLLKSDSN